MNLQNLNVPFFFFLMAQTKKGTESILDTCSTLETGGTRRMQQTPWLSVCVEEQKEGHISQDIEVLKSQNTEGGEAYKCHPLLHLFCLVTQFSSYIHRLTPSLF